MGTLRATAPERLPAAERWPCRCRGMVEKRMPHLRWSKCRPPMLAFESYVLVQKN